MRWARPRRTKSGRASGGRSRPLQHRRRHRDRWADATPDATALIHEDESGAVREHTFADVREAASRLANALAGLGLGPRRPGRHAPAAAPETAIAHLATYRAGLIAVPLFVLFGPDALEYRLRDSGARGARHRHRELAKGRRDPRALPDLRARARRRRRAASTTRSISPRRWRGAPAPSRRATPPPTSRRSSSTPRARPASRKARCTPTAFLLGHLPGVQLPHDFFPQPGDRFWTPADWAWIGGLSTCCCRRGTSACRPGARAPASSTPSARSTLMARARRAQRLPAADGAEADAPGGRPRRRPALALRSVGSGGETLGGELLEWGRETFGVDDQRVLRPDRVQPARRRTRRRCCRSGRARWAGAVPGHDGRGHRRRRAAGCRPATIGEIAVRRPDPVMFLELLEPARRHRAKVRRRLAAHRRSGPARRGRLPLVPGRADDVITSAGYRIGPGEIEDCLLRHPA